MRRMYAVLIIAVVVVALNVTQLLTVNKYIDEISQMVDYSYTALNSGDTEKAYKDLHTTADSFTNRISYMRLFVDEGELEDISQSVNMYLEYVSRGEISLAAAQYRAITSAIDHANY